MTGVGLVVYSDSDCVITENDFGNTSITLYKAGEENRIYLNNNVSGVTLSGTAPTTTYWNATTPITYTYKGTTHTGYPGNFWSNYTGEDADGDGIIDTPYVLPDSLGTDHAPLMGAWENDTITAGSSGEPRTWYVDVGGSGDFTTIQAAVDAASAGDTIVVKDGAYTESVDVTRPLTIMSENGPDNVTVTTDSASKPVFSIQAEGVVIRGFSVRGPTNEHVAGIESVGYSNCTIVNNDCTDCYNGVHLGGNATNCNVTENYCHDNSRRGISLRDTAHGNYVYNNYCTGNADDQICIKDSTHDNYIWANTFNGTVECLTADIFNSTEPIAYTYKGTTYTGFVGNYYSGYTGEDTNNDGIGDTPYVLSADQGYGTDYAPLMGAWENGTIVGSDAPSAVTITSPVSGSSSEIGLPVRFSAAASGTNLTYLWETGNGDTLTGQNVTYTYSQAGTYTVNLTVSNEYGNASARTAIVITKPEPIVFNTSVTVYEDEPIVVDNVTYGSNTFFNILAAAGYTYTYGDSESGYSDRKPLLTLTIDNVTYPTRNFGDDYKWKFYKTLGTGDDYKYKASLNGYIDESGTYYIWYGDMSQFSGWDLPAINNSIYVVELNVDLQPTQPGSDTAPVASFTANVTSGEAPLAVAFTDTSLNTPTSWLWDFGDNTTSIEQNPTHTYTTAGTYTITLTAGNAAGSNSTTRSIVVTSPGDDEQPANATLILHPGWNFVSTPLTLADGENTFGIFDGVVDSAGHSVLLYDGNEGWKAMTKNDIFEPIDGVWLYANGTYEIPLQFAVGSAVTPPAKSLDKGWNAIGFTDTVPTSAVNTLHSVDGTWATVIGFDAETQEFGVSIIRGAEGRHGETRDMSPMQGYWLYMNEPDTLGAIGA